MILWKKIWLYLLSARLHNVWSPVDVTHFSVFFFGVKVNFCQNTIFCLSPCVLLRGCLYRPIIRTKAADSTPEVSTSACAKSIWCFRPIIRTKAPDSTPEVSTSACAKSIWCFRWTQWPQEKPSKNWNLHYARKWRVDSILCRVIRFHLFSGTFRMMSLQWEYYVTCEFQHTEAECLHLTRLFFFFPRLQVACEENWFNGQFTVASHFRFVTMITAHWASDKRYCGLLEIRKWKSIAAVSVVCGGLWYLKWEWRERLRCSD